MLQSLTSAAECFRITELAYAGKRLHAMLCSNAAGSLTALHELSAWRAAEVTETGYARATTILGSGAYVAGAFTPPSASFTFTATTVGYVFDSLVIWLDGEVYPSVVLTEDPETVVRSGHSFTYKVNLGSTRLVYASILAPIKGFALSGVEPIVSAAAPVLVPAKTLDILPAAPQVSIGAAVASPSSGLAVGGLNVSIEAGLAYINVPLSGLNLSAYSANLALGTSVLVPSITFSLIPNAIGIGAGDDYYSNLAAQVFTLLRDWRVDWWGD